MGKCPGDTPVARSPLFPRCYLLCIAASNRKHIYPNSLTYLLCPYEPCWTLGEKQRRNEGRLTGGWKEMDTLLPSAYTIHVILSKHSGRTIHIIMVCALSVMSMTESTTGQQKRSRQRRLIPASATSSPDESWRGHRGMLSGRVYGRRVTPLGSLDRFTRARRQL